MEEYTVPIVAGRPAIEGQIVTRSDDAAYWPVVRPHRGELVPVTLTAFSRPPPMYQGAHRRRRPWPFWLSATVWLVLPSVLAGAAFGFLAGRLAG